MPGRGTRDGDADWAAQFGEEKERILLKLYQEHWPPPTKVIPHVRGYEIYRTKPLTNFPFRSTTEHGPVTQLAGVPRGAWNATFFGNLYRKSPNPPGVKPKILDWHIISLDIFREYEEEVEPRKVTESGEADRPSHYLKLWDINQFHPSLLIACSPGVWAQIKWRQHELF